MIQCVCIFGKCVIMSEVCARQEPEVVILRLKKKVLCYGRNSIDMSYKEQQPLSRKFAQLRWTQRRVGKASKTPDKKINVLCLWRNSIESC